MSNSIHIGWETGTWRLTNHEHGQTDSYDLPIRHPLFYSSAYWIISQSCFVSNCSSYCLLTNLASACLVRVKESTLDVGLSVGWDSVYSLERVVMKVMASRGDLQLSTASRWYFPQSQSLVLVRDGGWECMLKIHTSSTRPRIWDESPACYLYPGSSWKEDWWLNLASRSEVCCLCYVNNHTAFSKGDVMSAWIAMAVGYTWEKAIPVSLNLW